MNVHLINADVKTYLFFYHSITKPFLVCVVKIGTSLSQNGAISPNLRWLREKERHPFRFGRSHLRELKNDKDTLLVNKLQIDPISNKIQRVYRISCS